MAKKEERDLKAAGTPAELQAKSASEDYFADFDFSNLEISLEAMFKNGVHFGHRRSHLHPAMKPYIFTVKNEICIIDLQKTAEKLEEALKFLAEVKKSGKKVLLVGTKKPIRGLVKSAAERLQVPYIVERWLGGTFTNFPVVKKRARYLKENLEKMERGEFKVYTKLEQSKKAEELEKLERKMGGIVGMEELPGAVVVADAKEDYLALKEARKVGVPAVALVDTNNDPRLADYFIPANDDAISSVGLILGYICKTLIEK